MKWNPASVAWGYIFKHLYYSTDKNPAIWQNAFCFITKDYFKKHNSVHSGDNLNTKNPYCTANKK